MPHQNQKSVTIPKYVWNFAEEYFKKNEAQLKKKGICSVTKLIQAWILEQI